METRDTFTVAVSWSTHDDLKAGLPEKGVRFACVLATSEREAHLIAAQLTACTGRMPTRTETVEVRI